MENDEKVDHLEGLLQITKLLLNNLQKELNTFGSKPIRESITSTNQYINEVESKHELFSIEKLCKPFFLASDARIFNYEPICLDFYAACFQFSSLEVCPSWDLAYEIIKHSLHFSLETPNESRLKMCKVITALFQSPVGVLLLHDERIMRANIFLLQIHSLSFDESPIEVAEMTLREFFRSVVSHFYHTMPLPNYSDTSKLSGWVAQVATTFSQTTFKYSPCKTIWEADLFCLVSSISVFTQKNTRSVRTLVLCANLLSELLSTDFPYFQTPGFAALLKTEIHMILLTLVLDKHQKLAVPTANLILVVWKRFSSLYLEGLSDIIEQGITATMSSPDPLIVVRGCTMLMLFANEPQLFVDLYVNYDCDNSGTFKNVFQRLIESLISHCYKEKGPDDIQETSLATLVKIISSLWEYFESHSKTNESKEKKEAENKKAAALLKAKEEKNIFLGGSAIFKESPWKGLRFFQEHNICGKTPDEIARFLLHTHEIDPAGIGEIIGGHKNGAQDILKAYVNLFDFKGKGFEAAFREFLTTFQIPGEGQMIDRIMEQFGSKYDHDNPGVFSSSDTVYVIAYSALMLHTDAHNPQVRKKMDLQAFIKNNSGIDQGKDLPVEFLTDLYNGITSKQIFATTASSEFSSSPLLTRAQKAELYEARCKETLKQARSNIQYSKSCGQSFVTSSSPLIIRPLFSCIWGGILAVFSLGFEETSYTQLCLKGLTLSAHIASHCYIEDALSAIIDAYNKFTRLNLFDFQAKNIQCINSLIKLTSEDLPWLKGVWRTEIKSISSLAQLKRSTLEIKDLSKAEEIFKRSAELDSESILEFCQAICEVSLSELSRKKPRFFLLQHIYGIIVDNMLRPKIDWIKIWEIFGSYLIRIASSSIPGIREKALEILQMTATQFLTQNSEEKQDGVKSSYHYNQRILTPFLDFASNCQDKDMLNKLIVIVEQFYKKFGASLGSGWITIFQIFSFYATIPSFQGLVYDSLRDILENHITTNELDMGQIAFLVTAIESLEYHITDGINSEEAVYWFSEITRNLEISPEIWDVIFASIASCANKVPCSAVSTLLNTILGSKSQVPEQQWNNLFGKIAMPLLSKVDEPLKCAFVEGIFCENNLIVLKNNLKAKNFLEEGSKSNEKDFAETCLKVLNSFKN